MPNRTQIPLNSADLAKGARDGGERVRSKKKVGMWGVAALLLTMIATPAQAGAQTRRDASQHARADFEGRKIDLAGDWGEAQACLIWRQGGVTECFRTTQELDAREAALAPRRAASAPKTSASGQSDESDSYSYSYSYYCSSSLRLYEYNWYGGRRLSFWDRGYWQNLYLYGFEDMTSSYIVGACPVWLAEHADGGGWWYPGPTYAYAGEPAMQWGWQDTISSIYIG